VPFLHHHTSAISHPQTECSIRHTVRQATGHSGLYWFLISPRKTLPYTKTKQYVHYYPSAVLRGVIQVKLAGGPCI